MQFRSVPLIAVILVGSANTATAQRALGIDVSDYQGTINWTTVSKPVAQGGGGIQFSFIRASRGGTTGVYNENTRVGTLSHRYDDLTFNTNIASATNAGVLAGPYHFARIDRINATDPSDPTYAGNTGLDEANHFLQKAGNFMRPGYLRPVCDVEAGDVETTSAVLTSWVLEFSDRILAVTGVRPIVYINSNYANREVDSRINIHDLWLARYIDPAVVNTQTSDPPAASGLPNVYGVWNPSYPTIPAIKPWDFWQYTSSGTLPGISGAVDRDVANGDIEFVKDFLVPAIWNVDASGEWTTASNWNGVTYLPKAKDRVIISRAAGNYTVTLSSGNQSVRSLQVDERLTVNGGSLAVEQAIFGSASTVITINSGIVTSAAFGNIGTFTQNGGTFTTGNVTNTTGLGTLAIAGGTLRATSIHQAALNISDGNVELLGTATSVVSTLATTGTGTLDLAVAKLVVDYATGSISPLPSIRDSLTAGQIKTTAGGPTVGVAYFQAADLFTAFPATFGGQSVDVSSILLTRALIGDANLDGVVGFTDLAAVAQNYNLAARWNGGDFTYDGVVGFGDLAAIAQNYGATIGLNGVIAGDASGFSADWALAQSLVPEPATGVVLLCGVAVCRRRR